MAFGFDSYAQDAFSTSGGGPVNVTVSATGVAGTTSLGVVVTNFDMVFEVTGVQATGAIANVNAGAGVIVNPTGVSATAELGNETIFVGILVPVNNTNLLMTTELGTAEAILPITAEVTGVSATAHLGQETVVAGNVIAKPRGDETFNVTVANNGSGNVYYLNHFMQTTLDSLHPPFTYRFDQSDSSNSNHPLRFSTVPDGTHAENETFTITVQSTASGNKYFVNGVQQQMPIALKKGSTYKFDQSNNTNNNHPLRFSTTSDGSHAGGSEYTDGVTVVGVPGQTGAYTQIVVPNNAPATLYTYCINHSGMGFGVPITEGVEYTTGVVKNGVPGNPGAYVEITLADDTPQLYVYCQNHSGMGFKLDQQYNAEIIGNTALNSVTIKASQLIPVNNSGMNVFGIVGDVNVTGTALITPTGVSATGFISSGQVPAVNVWQVIDDSQTPGWTEIAA